MKRLEVILPNLSDDKRAELETLVSQLCVAARIDEIQQFAIQGREQGFTNDPKIISYFMGRTVMLGMELNRDGNS